MALERLRTEVGSIEDARRTFRQIDRLLGLLANQTTLLRTVKHAPAHLTDGGDEIDGDQLDVDFTPVNYTPSKTPPEADDLDHLAAHLYGIDQALFTVASIDHTLLLNIGTNTHVQIDDHIVKVVDPHGSVMEVSLALQTQLVLSTTGMLDFEIRDLLADATIRIKNITGGSFKANLDVEKNIILGGTVNGRDVATDGTKLDTLETNADVTDSTNVAAAGAAMLAGQIGGQVLKGATTASGNLMLQSTSHATRGKIILGGAGKSAYDEFKESLGIGILTPGSVLPSGFALGHVIELRSTAIQTDAGLFLRRSDAVTGLDIWQKGNSPYHNYFDARWTAGDFIWRNATSSTPVELMRLSAAGDLSILVGHTILSDEKTIKTGTSDGADNESIGIAGGGSLSSLRGSFVRVSGNEDGNTGKLFLTAGNVAGGEVVISTGGAARITIDENGLIGFKTATPQKDLHISSAVPTIRLSDSTAGTDQAVATLIEFYRGDNTNRVGFWGMASASNDVMVLGTDYTAGEISLRTGINVERLNISSAGDFDFQAGNLTTTGNLTVTGTIVTPTIVSFVNATHDHQSAAGGGTLDAAAITAGTLADARIDAKYRTWSKTFLIGTTANPVSGSDPSLPIGMIPKASTLKFVRYTCDGTSTPTVTFNIAKVADASPFSAGNNIWTPGNKTATATTASTTSFDAGSLIDRDVLQVEIVSTTGSPVTLRLVIEGEYD